MAPESDVSGQEALDLLPQSGHGHCWSLPAAREATVNTVTGPGAGGVSLDPLSEGPCWHSPWGSMVSPLFRGIRGGCELQNLVDRHTQTPLCVPEGGP